MKLDRLLELTRNPSLLGADESQDLETLVQEYPYFSAAQLLLTIKYKQQNTSRFNRQLQKAAAHLPDKNVLAVALHEDLARMQLLASEEIESIPQVEAISFESNQKEDEIEVVQELEQEAENAEVISLDHFNNEAEVALEDRVTDTADNDATTEKEEAQSEVKVEIEDVEVGKVEVEEEEVGKEEVGKEEVTLEEALHLVLEDTPVGEPTQFLTEVVHDDSETASGTKLPEQNFLAVAHDRLSWFRFFAGKPLREQPADVLEELYQEHMSGDFLKAEAATLPEIKSELKAVINHDTEVARDKNLEEEIRRLAYESISDEELPASETLAAIYESQKDYKKALRIYQKLMLKFPDRMTYFAGLIASTKEKLNN